MQTTAQETESNPFGDSTETASEKPAETVASSGDDFEQLKQKLKSLQEADAPAVDEATKEEDKVDERDV